MRESFGFESHVIPNLIRYIRDKIKEEKNPDTSQPHPRQETLDFLEKHDGFCSANTLLILTSTLLGKIPRDSDSKTIRDDYETIQALLELISRRHVLTNRKEELECDKACERIIQYLFSIQILVDTQRSSQAILSIEDKGTPRRYHQMVEIAYSKDKQTELKKAPLEVEFQISGYTDKSNLSDFIDFIPEDRIYSVNIHSQNPNFEESGHNVGILKTKEQDETVYYFVDYNGENFRERITSVEELSQCIIEAAEKVDFTDDIYINCQSLKFNAPGFENKPVTYPDKTELLKKIHVPGKEVSCVSYAESHGDHESADFYIQQKKLMESPLIEKLDDLDEDFDDILGEVFPSLSFRPSRNEKDYNGSTENFTLTPKAVEELNQLLKAVPVDMSFAINSEEKSGIRVNNLTRANLKSCINSPHYKNIMAISSGRQVQSTGFSAGFFSQRRRETRDQSYSAHREEPAHCRL